MITVEPFRVRGEAASYKTWEETDRSARTGHWIPECQRRRSSTIMRTGSNFAVLAAASLTLCAPAQAQIGVPPVPVPQIPVQLPLDLGGTANEIGAAGARDLRELRRVRIRNLLRANRATLEADPRGAPILRNEVTALSPSPEALARAQAAGFSVSRTRNLEGLDATIVVLEAPAGMSTRRALDRLRDADPTGIYDFNHVYSGSGEEVAPASPTTAARSELAPLPSGLKVGVIDGGVLRSHPAFDGISIHEHGCGGAVVATSHATSVASLIVGRADDFHGAAPGAALYVADVYCGSAAGGAVDAVADSFAWMARERVPVINVSLVGPPNALLEQVVRIVTTRGHVVVAAVGNDGPSAPPLYPAAYPGVVAVTAVDGRNRVLLEACRGKHVDLAAPGSDMSAAAIEHPYELVRGTSFAAPIVAGMLAREVSLIDRQTADAAIAALNSRALDLGARGPDKIYGNGLVGETLRPTVSLASRGSVGPSAGAAARVAK
jgi:subtilisin family serine protease